MYRGTFDSVALANDSIKESTRVLKDEVGIRSQGTILIYQWRNAITDAGLILRNTEIEGTGSPEGVLSAPVGTYYTDLNQTLGAIRWHKSTGTGNTGWRCIIGDTGVLNVVTNPLWSGFSTQAGVVEVTELRAQRNGDSVKIDIALNKLVAAGVTFPAGAIPVGFMPASISVFTGLTSGPTLYRLFVGSDGSTVLNGPIATSVRSTLTYTTIRPWPTTL